MGFSSMTMVISVILAIVFGVAGVILDKTIIIAYTAITGALRSAELVLHYLLVHQGWCWFLESYLHFWESGCSHCMEREKDPAAGSSFGKPYGNESAGTKEGNEFFDWRSYKSSDAFC